MTYQGDPLNTTATPITVDEHMAYLRQERDELEKQLTSANATIRHLRSTSAAIGPEYHELAGATAAYRNVADVPLGEIVAELESLRLEVKELRQIRDVLRQELRQAFIERDGYRSGYEDAVAEVAALQQKVKESEAASAQAGKELIAALEREQKHVESLRQIAVEVDKTVALARDVGLLPPA